MKILGETGSGFILEASKTEIANLVGYYSEYSDEGKKTEHLKAGSEIRISEMYKQLYRLSEIPNTVRDIRCKLLHACETLSLVAPTIEECVLKDKGEAKAGGQ